MWEGLGEGPEVSALGRVIKEYQGHIEGTTKGPIVQRSSESDVNDVMEEDEQKVLLVYLVVKTLYQHNMTTLRCLLIASTKFSYISEWGKKR